jgi:hypothetical protein
MSQPGKKLQKRTWGPARGSSDLERARLVILILEIEGCCQKRQQKINDCEADLHAHMILMSDVLQRK